MDEENPFRVKDLENRKTRPTCQTCPYWHLMDWSEPDFTWGLCCIRAPSTIAKEDYEGERPESIWPGTLADDFCGEHPDFPAWIILQKVKASSPPPS